MWKERRILAAALAVAALAAFANALRCELFFDDQPLIVHNEYLRDWSRLGDIWTHGDLAGALGEGDLYRPVVMTVFALEWRLWQDWAPGYHGVNVAVHAADAVLLFFLLERLFGRRGAAFLAALAFAVHPVAAEAVTYASSLSDSLSLFFILIALHCYVRGWIAAAWFLQILALFSRESAVVLPFLVLLTAVFAERKPARAAIRACAPFALIAACYVALRFTVLDFGHTTDLMSGGADIGRGAAAYARDWTVRLFTFLKVLGVYLKLLFYPRDLYLERSAGFEVPAGPWQPEVIAGALIAAGLLAVSALASTRAPAVTFGVLWFFAALAPTSGIAIPINGYLSEHWLYVPMIGLSLACVWTGASAAERFGLRKPALAACLVYFAGLGVRTHYRNRDWRDAVTFFRQTVEHAPKSYRAMSNLGAAYGMAGNLEAAVRTLDRAIQMRPGDGLARANAAIVHAKMGNIDAAVREYREVIRLDPGAQPVHAELLRLLAANRRWPEARSIVEQTPSYNQPVLLILLAAAALEQNDREAALIYTERALRLPLDRRQQGEIDRLRRLAQWGW